jgi:hypothetical protein
VCQEGRIDKDDHDVHQQQRDLLLFIVTPWPDQRLVIRQVPRDHIERSVTI